MKEAGTHAHARLLLNACRQEWAFLLSKVPERFSRDSLPYSQLLCTNRSLRSGRPPSDVLSQAPLIPCNLFNFAYETGMKRNKMSACF